MDSVSTVRKAYLKRLADTIRPFALGGDEAASATLDALGIAIQRSPTEFVHRNYATGLMRGVRSGLGAHPAAYKLPLSVALAAYREALEAAVSINEAVTIAELSRLPGEGRRLMKVRPIDPEAQPTRRCEALAGKQTAEYRRELGKDPHCKRQALVEIDGRPYCRSHGGLVLLDLALAKGEV